MNVRENWRIGALTLFIVLSSVALFVPQGGAVTGDGVRTSDDFTNLQYGLDLSGGIEVQADLVGRFVEDLDIDPNRTATVTQAVASNLDVDAVDVEVSPRGGERGTIEVFANVSASDFSEAVRAANVDVSADEVQRGVTAETRQRAVEVINRKIQQGGLAGGTATLVNTPTGESYVVVETPSLDRQELLDIVTTQGEVRVDAVFPVDGPNGTEYNRVPLLYRQDFAGIGQANQAQNGNPPNVDVTLTTEAAQNFSAAMQRWGFTGEGQGQCTYRQNPEEPGWCLLTVADGNVTYSASMGELATDINQGTFVDSPSFVLQTRNYSEARDLLFDLETGALPTPLTVTSTSEILPSLAQDYKLFALLTGLFAWIAVSGAVFFRYRQIRVAIPLLLTAAAEVYILLGVAATVGLALDLSHIAGFIAVIGTGVDDLVIIADEILQEGKVATGRVFQNRFRKAFWVIGAAAATTLIAMSPLMILGLGDLSGFAIVTIVGVLIGVLVTRPAYGDVLRNLLLSEDQRD
jgi:preprotein translocase subunit SecD